MRNTIRWMLALCLSLGAARAADDSPAVNVYSYRKPQLIAPMFDAFTQRTGVKVNAVFAKKGMLERLKNEGANTPADLIFTTDIGRLTDLKNAGLTRAVNPAAWQADIPANYRDSDNHWFGLTSRARLFVVSESRVAPGEIESYEDLAKPKWRGRVCTRSGKHQYSVALIAMMMQHHGQADAAEWLRAVKANLARKPSGNDRAQVKAIHQGVCDVAIINHYYLHNMRNGNAEQQAAAASIRAVYPNQNGRGTHMNISGMAMTKHAPHKQHARALMAFLASSEAQQMFAQLNGEYPVNGDAAPNHFKQDSLALDQIAGLRRAASKMVDRVGFDE